MRQGFIRNVNGLGKARWIRHNQKREKHGNDVENTNGEGRESREEERKRSTEECGMIRKDLA